MHNIIPENLRNFSFTQNIEYYCTSKYQYLLIHKNGCAQVTQCINDNYYSDLQIKLIKTNNIPSWTVIRDPYERFISGLAYDIKNNYPNFKSFSDFFSSINPSELFLGKVSQQSSINGNLVHTYLQTTYLYNQNIDIFVNLKDLDLFLEIHFNKITPQRNPGVKEFKDQLHQYIESNSILKQIIYNYLNVDYYIINSISNSNSIWNWQNGKIF